MNNSNLSVPGQTPSPIGQPAQPDKSAFLAPQQQQCLDHHTLPQHLMQMPAKRQRFDSNLNRQHSPPLPPPQTQLLPSPAQCTGEYPGQNQGPCRGRGGSAGAGQSGGGVRAYLSGENFGGAESTQVEGPNTIPISSESAAAPAATQFQGAHGFNINGNNRFTNIGMNMGNLTTVNNYGGIHGLENLKDFVSFAALHDSAEQDPDRRCHPGTRETVLAQLRDWFDNPNPTDRIVWLHGPAGAGKSAIAQTIADEYKERGAAATFFFYRSDPNRNDGKRLFPTISWQLAFSIPHTKDFIVDALNNTPHLPTQAVEPQFERLVARPFQSTNNATQMSHQTPVVIIDGVDECSDEKLQQRILSIIGNAVKNHHVPLRFLIASRPEAMIEETVDKFKDFTVSIDLAKLDDSHRDIHKYLEDKFSEIASTRGLDPTWPGQPIIEEVVSKSSGNFIFPSLVIRFISDEDYNPEFLLNIVRNLTPCGRMSPFALLDELFMEILQRHRDQGFLKTFLALLVGRSSIDGKDLHEDDATLMNVSEKDLHIRLRRMRSLLKFKPFIDVYHKSFLDFLQDSSRSGQYHISKEGGLKRYLELIVELVARHVSMAMEQSTRHEGCRFNKFTPLLDCHPPKIVMPVEEWQEALKPLLDLQDKGLKASKPHCCITQVMRDLLLHLAIFQGKPHPIIAQAPESNTNEIVTEWSPTLVTKAKDSVGEKDLDSRVSVFLSCLRKTNSALTVDATVIDCMSSLLAFDYAEIVARVQCISDAQNLVDIIDLLINNKSFLTRCGPDAARKAAYLSSAMFARVPLLQQSLFVNKPVRYFDGKGYLIELICQTVFISKILDHNYVFPVLGIYRDQDQFGYEIVIEQSENVAEWLRRSRPDFITRIRVMLEIARIIRYIHSMDIALHPDSIELGYFFLDTNFRVKIRFMGLFTWWVRETAIYGYIISSAFWPAETLCTCESNISNFAKLFHRVCFGGHVENLPNRLVEQALQLIERCRDPKSRPTMEDVVKEMETWDLT